MLPNGSSGSAGPGIGGAPHRTGRVPPTSSSDAVGDPFQGLLRLAGRYRGRQPDAHGTYVVGELSLVPIVGSAGLLLRFSCRNEGGACVHEEYTLIGPSEDGRLVLWNLNDATRTMHTYGLRDARVADGQAAFEFGASARTPDSPRIALVLEADGAVVYTSGSGARAAGARSVRMPRVD